MKKLAFILLVVSFVACKTDKKKISKAKYSLETKTTKINWTAFKTTDKVPVKGTFKTINVVNNHVSESPLEALNNIEFSIPVNSIDSKNEKRDAKLVKYFFGTMKNTTALIGKLNVSKDGKGTVNLRMNGISKDFPITHTISGQLVQINATINLDNWEGKLAIDALNKACNELHKGKDGISKTWSEVQINIAAYLKVE